MSDETRDPEVPKDPASVAPGEGVGAVQPTAPAEGAGEPTQAGAEAEAAARARAAQAAGVPDAVEKPAAPAPAAPAAETPAVTAPAAPAAPAASDQPASDQDAAAKAAAKAAAIEKAKAAAEAKKAAAAAAAAGGGGAAAGAEKPAAAAAKPKPHHEEDPNKPVWEKEPVSPEWKDAADDPLVTALRKEFGEAVDPVDPIESARSFAGDLTLVLRREAVADVCRSLKERHRFTYLIDVCGADYPKREPRFDVVYHLHSFEANRRIRLKVATDEATPVPSVAGVFRTANWCEREVYDMYGVRFAGHPDMTRILLWEGFNGYPLRKDFPVEGIDTGSAIYPEYYEPTAGPVAGSGTGWQPPKPKPEAKGEGEKPAS